MATTDTTTNGINHSSEYSIQQPENGQSYIAARSSLSGRMNPFDWDGDSMPVNDDHFEPSTPEKTPTILQHDSASVSSNDVQSISESLNQMNIKRRESSRLLADLAEDHFSKPDSALLGLNSVEELKTAISSCTQRICALDRELANSRADTERENANEEVSERRTKLVRLLVALRLRLHEIAAPSTDKSSSKILHTLGHRFIDSRSSELRSITSNETAGSNGSESAFQLFLLSNSWSKCECCAKPIWNLQDCFTCTRCVYRVHNRCLQLVTRRCIALRVVEPSAEVEPSANRRFYELAICPERGLTAQHFRCAECRQSFAVQNEGAASSLRIMASSDFVGTEKKSRSGQLSFLTSLSATFNDEDSPSTSQPAADISRVIDETKFSVRQCDYNGLYYCASCHWNDVAVIPARVVHNWDFQPRPISRASKQLLALLQNRAVLNLDQLNTRLFKLVPALSRIREMRETILKMKRYFLHCRNALDSGILLMLSNRQHFVESSDFFSMRDLIDVHEGSLERELCDIVVNFARHIRHDCALCQAKAFICEICSNEEDLLFLFDDLEMKISICEVCSTIYHKGCFQKAGRRCRKCDRMQRRKNLSDIESES